MRLQKRKVDGYEWRCRNQSKDNRHDVVRSLKISEELGVVQSVISRLWQRFQDDGNVSRCYRTGHPRVTTPNEDRYLAVLPKETDGSQHKTCLVSSLQLPVRQFEGRPCTDA
ncbi:uncharacterized protein TNCV_3564071 [Trichonephila clavipes]|nr:uncharacterized protein TNCV_3564071 [Trichonephila clavipes]